jgi:hypothetical protein
MSRLINVTGVVVLERRLGLHATNDFGAHKFAFGRLSRMKHEKNSSPSDLTGIPSKPSIYLDSQDSR